MPEHPSRASRKKKQEALPPIGNFATVDGLLTYLARHGIAELRIKEIRSPDIPYRSGVMHHYAVHLSACIHTLTGTPLMYATFLAATTVQLGEQISLTYPLDNGLKREQADRVALDLERAMSDTIRHLIEAKGQIQHLDEDCAWSVPNLWSGLSRAFHWAPGYWKPLPSPLYSSTTVS